MLDRFGRVIRIGWSEHELLWVEAANTLERPLLYAALRDIADMTGRSYAAVLAKAKYMRYAAKEAGLQKQRKADQDLLFVPVPALQGPSKELLMSGRAYVGKSPIHATTAH